MNQTWTNDKKPSFGPDFGLFDPNLGPKICFRGFYLQLDIIASYYAYNFKEK